MAAVTVRVQVRRGRTPRTRTAGRGPNGVCTTLPAPSAGRVRPGAFLQPGPHPAPRRYISPPRPGRGVTTCPAAHRGAGEPAVARVAHQLLAGFVLDRGGRALAGPVVGEPAAVTGQGLQSGRWRTPVTRQAGSTPRPNPGCPDTPGSAARQRTSTAPAGNRRTPRRPRRPAHRRRVFLPVEVQGERLFGGVVLEQPGRDPGRRRPVLEPFQGQPERGCGGDLTVWRRGRRTSRPGQWWSTPTVAVISARVT